MTRWIGRRLTHFGPVAALLLVTSPVPSAAEETVSPAVVAKTPANRPETAKSDQLLAAANEAKTLTSAGPAAAMPLDGSLPKGPLPSEAEQITTLQKAIESDSRRVGELRQGLGDPKSEYRQAEAKFKECDEALSAAKTALAKLTESGNVEDATAAQAALPELKRTWELARERFDLVLESRKTEQEQISTLEAKLQKNRKALEKLLGTVPAPEGVPATEGLKEAAAPASTTVAPGPVQLPTPVAPAPPSTAGGASASPTAPQAAARASSVGAPVVEALAVPVKVPTKELIDAQSVVERKQEEAVVAKQAAESVAERIAALDKDIGLENKLLVAARKKADLAFQTRGELEQEYERLVSGAAPIVEIRALQKRRREADEQFSKARQEVAERTDRLNDLQTQLASLQSEALAAATEVAQKQQEVDRARDRVASLQNPFSPTNILQWLLDHGPRVAIILLALLVMRLTAGLGSKRITNLISQRGSRGTIQEREDRARTLVGVFRNAFSITTTIGGTLMICEEIGIAVGPLMGGAAVLGLGVAFGAQNLIRDYFYGFVILIENQYKLNDVLKIGELSGQVEQITLRMTVLRDVEGNVHFVPNGKIDSVTNMSHGWARALIEVNVAYKEDVDHCLNVVMALAEDLQQDPDFSNSFLDRPEKVGVESLGEFAVKIRCLIKTRPLHQWRVKREMFRRIKRRFDELGIEIPFPQRTLHHRHEGVSGARDEVASKHAA